jgi:hypothetical protein
MKKNQSLAFMALILMMGCSKDYLTSAEQNAAASEKNNLTASAGARQNPPSNGINGITFFSNAITNNVFFENNCLPPGRFLLRDGNFSGKLSGYGKINSSLSTYQFVPPCGTLPNENPAEPFKYTLIAQGKLALTASDYCSITITGTIDPKYYTEFGFSGGAFIGTAITGSGVGKLKALDNKSFSVYNGNLTGPSINFATGTITLRFTDN